VAEALARCGLWPGDSRRPGGGGVGHQAAGAPRSPSKFLWAGARPRPAPVPP
jgi:hypothetical protein